METLRLPEHFIGIPNHSQPTQLSDAVYNLARVQSAHGKIPTLHNQVGADLLQVTDHRFQGGEVTVNVGNNGKPHAYPYFKTSDKCRGH